MTKSCLSSIEKKNPCAKRNTHRCMLAYDCSQPEEMGGRKLSCKLMSKIQNIKGLGKVKKNEKYHAN